MSNVLGNSGSYVGWIAQSLYAIKFLYENDIDSIEYEVVDDLGFWLHDKYCLIQVKNDFSGSQSLQKIKDEISKMRKKANANNIEDSKLDLLFCVSAKDDALKNKIEKANIGEKENVRFIFSENLACEVANLLDEKLNDINTQDEFMAYLVCSYIAMKVFNTYKNNVEKDKKIIIEKKAINKILAQVSYKKVIDLIFEVEYDVLRDMIHSEANKYGKFVQKFPGAESRISENAYNRQFSYYLDFRRRTTTKQLIKSGYFISKELISVDTYREKDPKTIDEYIKLQEKLAENTWFVHHESSRRVEETIRKGVLIKGVEDDVRGW